MKNPNELIAELKDFLTSIEKDAAKASRGMKAGGIRLRASMQKVKDFAAAIRKSVLEHRSTKPTKAEEVKEAEPVEAEKVYEADDEKTEIVKLPEFSPYWYSDFNY